MDETIKCKACETDFVVKRTGNKCTNGSWERIYSNGLMCTVLKCHDCAKAHTRKYWAASDQKQKSKSYEKTKKGLLVRAYRNMQSRVTGVQAKKAHLYKGLEILSRESFYRWALSNTEYHKIHDAWTESNYDRKLSPSIDRIDSSKGYFLENMRWLTHSENSRLGNQSRFEKS